MKKYLLGIIVISIIVPQITFASWWNPFSWFKKKEPVVQVQIPNPFDFDKFVEEQGKKIKPALKVEELIEEDAYIPSNMPEVTPSINDLEVLNEAMNKQMEQINKNYKEQLEQLGKFNPEDYDYSANFTPQYIQPYEYQHQLINTTCNFYGETLNCTTYQY